MKHVTGGRTFSTDEFNADELITEIGDYLTVLRWHLGSMTPSVDRTRAFERVDEIEKSLLVHLRKKVAKMLPFVPDDVQAAEKL